MASNVAGVKTPFRERPSSFALAASNFDSSASAFNVRAPPKAAAGGGDDSGPAMDENGSPVKRTMTLSPASFNFTRKLTMKSSRVTPGDSPPGAGRRQASMVSAASDEEDADDPSTFSRAKSSGVLSSSMSKANFSRKDEQQQQQQQAGDGSGVKDKSYMSGVIQKTAGGAIVKTATSNSGNIKNGRIVRIPSSWKEFTTFSLTLLAVNTILIIPVFVYIVYIFFYGQIGTMATVLTLRGVMSVTATGKIGINTLTPTAALDISNRDREDTILRLANVPDTLNTPRKQAIEFGQYNQDGTFDTSFSIFTNRVSSSLTQLVFQGGNVVVSQHLLVENSTTIQGSLIMAPAINTNSSNNITVTNIENIAMANEDGGLAVRRGSQNVFSISKTGFFNVTGAFQAQSADFLSSMTGGSLLVSSVGPQVSTIQSTTADSVVHVASQDGFRSQLLLSNSFGKASMTLIPDLQGGSLDFAMQELNSGQMRSILNIDTATVTLHSPVTNIVNDASTAMNVISSTGDSLLRLSSAAAVAGASTTSTLELSAGNATFALKNNNGTSMRIEYASQPVMTIGTNGTVDVIASTFSVLGDLSGTPSSLNIEGLLRGAGNSTFRVVSENINGTSSLQLKNAAASYSFVSYNTSLSVMHNDFPLMVMDGQASSFALNVDTISVIRDAPVAMILQSTVGSSSLQLQSPTTEDSSIRLISGAKQVEFITNDQSQFVLTVGSTVAGGRNIMVVDAITNAITFNTSSVIVTGNFSVDGEASFGGNVRILNRKGLQFGDDSTEIVSLYRNSTTDLALHTDGHFVVNGSMTVDGNVTLRSSAFFGGNVTTGAIRFSNDAGSDVSIYSTASDQLFVNQNFLVNQTMTVGDSLVVSNDMTINGSLFLAKPGGGVGGQIVFGDSGVTLYADTTNTLHTPNQFVVHGTMRVDQDLAVTGTIFSSLSNNLGFQQRTFLSPPNIGPNKYSANHDMAYVNGRDGVPLIVFRDAGLATSGGLRSIHCLDPACINYDSWDLQTNGEGAGVSLTLQDDGLAIMVYSNTAGTKLVFARCVDLFCTGLNTTTLESSATGILGGLTVLLGSDGFPFITYTKTSNNLAVIHCTSTDCSTKDTTTVFNSIQACFVTATISGDGLPLIAYYSSTGSGTISNVNPTADPTNWPGYPSGSASIPVCSGGCAPTFAHCASVSCTVFAPAAPVQVTANLNPSNSYPIALATGADGFPIIVIAESTTVKAIKCANTMCSGNSMTALDIDNTGGPGVVTGTVAFGPAIAITIGFETFPLVIVPQAYKATIGSTPVYSVKAIHCSNRDCSKATSIIVETDAAGGGTTNIVGAAVAVSVGTDHQPAYAQLVYDGGTSTLVPRYTHCSNFLCIPYYRQR